MALAVGDEAPNFDLSSTEDVLLMLRDEVVRTAIVLYVCGDAAADGARADLLALARAAADLATAHARVLVVSASDVETLKAVQRELHLPYPLLHDDRAFAVRYDVVAREGAEPSPRVLVVDRGQRVAWLGDVGGSVDDALPAIRETLRKLPSPSASLPRQVVNRVVDRWVN
ncbi:MAG: redoxin domain-containing protein [Thermoanaerobaculia bacterium]